MSDRPATRTEERATWVPPRNGVPGRWVYETVEVPVAPRPLPSGTEPNVFGWIGMILLLLLVLWGWSALTGGDDDPPGQDCRVEEQVLDQQILCEPAD